MTATKESTRVHIRWCIRRDMGSILAIDKESFSEPWSEEDFLRVLRMRNCICFVAEHGGEVLGFMVYELKKKSLSLMRMAVGERSRNKTVGRQMVEKLLSKLANHRRPVLTAKVNERNTGGLLFLRQLGLKATRVLRAHYENGDDAYLMSAWLESPVPPHNRISQVD